MPAVNAENMEAFLKHFAERTQGRNIVIVMDGASWHKEDLFSNFSHIRMIKLPPYSPELNPVEKFWQHVKDHTIKNKVYETLEALEEEICSFFRSLSPETVQTVCRASYV